MKKLFLFVFILVLAILSYAQVPVKPNQPYVKTVDANTYFGTKISNDTLFLKVSDAISATSYFYTKQQTQALLINTQLIVGLQSYGSPLKALPFGVTMSDLFSSNSTMVDGTLWNMLLEVKDTITVTGVGYVQHTQGAYTSDQYNGFAIYSTTGGTDTKVVETVNDGNIWKAASNSKVEKAFATPQVLLPGNYKICAVWNASATTTAPILYTHTGVSANITYLLPNSQKISGTVAVQNSMPTTIANSSLTSQSNFLGIYLY